MLGDQHKALDRLPQAHLVAQQAAAGAVHRGWDELSPDPHPGPEGGGRGGCGVIGGSCAPLPLSPVDVQDLAVGVDQLRPGGVQAHYTAAARVAQLLTADHPLQPLRMRSEMGC